MMLLTGFVSAAEALEMGLVSEVVPDEVETRAFEIAAKSLNATLAVKLTKEVVNAGWMYF